MGYINQVSATASNSPKITISMWVRLDTAASVTLLEFGYANGGNDFANNRIIINNEVGNAYNNFFGVSFQGAPDSFSASGYLTTTDSIHDNTWIGATDPSATWTPGFAIQANNAGSAVAPETWFHLLIAADFTNEVVAGGTCNTFFFFLNGARLDIAASDGRVVNQATGQVQQGFFSVSSGDAPYSSGPFSFSRTVGGGFTATLTGSVPGFPLDLNGTEIGIPAKAAHAAGGVTGNPVPIKMALPIIYVGQFIDPTNADNLAKFITPEGNPVAPSVAVAAFGTPTYSFTGSAADITNSGDGGAFTKTGTVTDATPGP